MSQSFSDQLLVARVNTLKDRIDLLLDLGVFSKEYSKGFKPVNISDYSDNERHSLKNSDTLRYIKSIFHEENNKIQIKDLLNKLIDRYSKKMSDNIMNEIKPN